MPSGRGSLEEEGGTKLCTTRLPLGIKTLGTTGGLSPPLGRYSILRPRR
uniref:Uncharacterized protein n=1 Tax=Siphoviridae sp. ctEBu1 TaxID=2825393 RepID=A0A8S5QFU0_9CAUD|nr:MAG TPA: hypothetical protein [Siphoviridae sp. ctEBu1]